MAHFRLAPSLPGRLLLLTLATSTALLLPGALARTSASDPPAFREALLAKINRFRADHDLPPLKADPRLQAASQEWAERLAAERRLQHRCADSLSSLLDDGGWETINENLYCSPQPLDPGKVIADWKRSPLHRKNILNPAIRFAGLGLAIATSGSAYVVFNGAGGRQRKSWEDLWERLPFGRRGP
ncbi:MAG: CAP domain-containing protein [Candidatus Methylacidiphilaceae bacterium]